MGEGPRKTRKRRSSEYAEGSLLASTNTEDSVEVSKIRKMDLEVGIKCFKEVRVEYPIHLPPSCTSNPLAGVIKILGAHLMR